MIDHQIVRNPYFTCIHAHKHIKKRPQYTTLVLLLLQSTQ